jgi:Ser/Thr protein kinase RdoA (MazF antagonist)
MSLAIVLLSGMVIGFFGGQMYIRWRVAIMTHRGPAALQEFMLGRIQARLHPQPDQMPAIKEAMGRVARNLEEHRRRQQAQQWAQIREALSEMRPALTAEQQRVLDHMSLDDLLPGPSPRSGP